MLLESLNLQQEEGKSVSKNFKFIDECKDSDLDLSLDTICRDEYSVCLNLNLVDKTNSFTDFVVGFKDNNLMNNLKNNSLYVMGIVCVTLSLSNSNKTFNLSDIDYEYHVLEFDFESGEYIPLNKFFKTEELIFKSNISTLKNTDSRTLDKMIKTYSIDAILNKYKDLKFEENYDEKDNVFKSRSIIEEVLLNMVDTSKDKPMVRKYSLVEIQNTINSILSELNYVTVFNQQKGSFDIYEEGYLNASEPEFIFSNESSYYNFIRKSIQNKLLQDIENLSDIDLYKTCIIYCNTFIM